MKQVVVHLSDRWVLVNVDDSVADGGVNSAWLDTQLSLKVQNGYPLAHPARQFHFSVNGRALDDAEALELGAEPLHVRANYRGGLLGGKGGFGANLRSSGRAGLAQRTMDFSLCRDLNGRRLKIVNDEARLRRWASPAEASKRARLGNDYKEPSGEHGIRGWLLGVPAWAEGVKRVRTDIQDSAELRRKTRLCRDWLHARGQMEDLATGQIVRMKGAPGRVAGPPRGAAPWWGCPRGARCEFAHGEDDLRDRKDIYGGGSSSTGSAGGAGQSRTAALADRRRAAAQERVQRLVDRAFSGISMYGGGALDDDDEGADGHDGGHGAGSAAGGPRRSMLAAVQAGLQRAQQQQQQAGTAGSAAVPAAGQKRRRDDESAGSSAGGHEAPAQPVVLLQADGGVLGSSTASEGGAAAAQGPSTVVSWRHGDWCLPVAMPASSNASGAGSLAWEPSVLVSHPAASVAAAADAGSASAGHPAALTGQSAPAVGHAVPEVLLEGVAPFGTVVVPGAGFPVLHDRAGAAAGPVGAAGPSSAATAGAQQATGTSVLPTLVDQCYAFSLQRAMPATAAAAGVAVDGDEDDEDVGVVQAGWVRGVMATVTHGSTATNGSTTTGFRPDPDGGLGVGDDGHSWGFDAGRGLAWHTPAETVAEATAGTAEIAGQEQDGEDDDEEEDDGLAGNGRGFGFGSGATAARPSSSSSSTATGTSASTATAGNAEKALLTGLREYARGARAYGEDTLAATGSTSSTAGGLQVGAAVPDGSNAQGTSKSVPRWSKGAVLTCFLEVRWSDKQAVAVPAITAVEASAGQSGESQAHAACRASARVVMSYALSEPVGTLAVGQSSAAAAAGQAASTAAQSAQWRHVHLGTAFEEDMTVTLTRVAVPLRDAGSAVSGTAAAAGHSADASTRYVWLPTPESALCAGVSLDAGEAVRLWPAMAVPGPSQAAVSVPRDNSSVSAGAANGGAATTAPVPGQHLAAMLHGLPVQPLSSAAVVSSTEVVRAVPATTVGQAQPTAKSSPAAAPQATAGASTASTAAAAAPVAPAAPTAAEAQAPAPPSFDLPSLLAHCDSLLAEADAEGGPEALASQRAALVGPRGPLFPPKLASAGCTTADLGTALAARGLKAGGTLQQRAERLAACLGLKPEDVPKMHRK